MYALIRAVVGLFGLIGVTCLAIGVAEARCCAVMADGGCNVVGFGGRLGELCFTPLYVEDGSSCFWNLGIHIGIFFSLVAAILGGVVWRRTTKVARPVKAQSLDAVGCQ